MLTSHHLPAPNLNYIWVGAPSSPTSGIVGHDIFFVKKMAAVNHNNPIFFWCLGEYKDYYTNEFKGTSVQVRSIENELSVKLSDPTVAKEALFVKNLMQEILKNDRNTIRDRVTVKNAFSLFLLFCYGNYVLDSNIEPNNMKQLKLNHNNKFRAPMIRNQDSDFWIMYSPPNNKKRIQMSMGVFISEWARVQSCYEQQGYTQYYHNLCSDIMRRSLFGNSINLIDTPLFWISDAANSQLSKIHVDELGITKHYFNTHTPRMCQEYDSPKALLRKEFCRLLSTTQMAFFHTSTKSIVFDYWFHPDEKPTTAIPPNMGPGVQYKEIHYAILDENSDDLKNLISLGVDVNQTILTTGETPADFAIRHSKFRSLKILFEHGARTYLKTGFR